jgi:hypothetical protein
MQLKLQLRAVLCHNNLQAQNGKRWNILKETLRLVALSGRSLRAEVVRQVIPRTSDFTERHTSTSALKTLSRLSRTMTDGLCHAALSNQ